MARVDAVTKKRSRAGLLAAAAEHFAEHGLDGANINRISIAAGLAKGTVYNYFPSKEALFFGVIEHACELAAAAAPQDRGEGVAARLGALLAADVAWARDHEPFARVLVRVALSGDPALQSRIIEAAAPYLSEVVTTLEEGVRCGEVRDDIPVAQLALIFTGLGNLALAQYWGSGGVWPPLDRIAPLITTMFLEGCRARAES